MQALDNICIVLVEPEHPGNIGATARAMANMGLSRLVLVAPADFPSPVATARASGAESILDAARIVGTLDEAIAECTLVVACTARARTVRWPERGPEDAMRGLLAGDGRDRAILFGRESTGLTNDELDRCQFHTRIPVADAFSSMNLGSAVSVMLYELRRQALAAREREVQIEPSSDDAQPPCTAEDLRHFYAHLQLVLDKSGTERAGSPKRLRVLKRIFNRASMRASEVHMFHGVLRSIESAMGREPD